jgi:soluble lytic murein transglycosylase-like protein
VPTVDPPGEGALAGGAGLRPRGRRGDARDDDRGCARSSPRTAPTRPWPRAYLSIGEARRAFILSSRHADALDPLPTTETRWVWDAGFPRPHAPLVEAAEDANGMPRHYLFAIMRQESGFNGRDVSNARAIGLLQMIPPTTRRVAQTLRIEYREDMLFDPAYNIRVGGWYIGRLYRQYTACSRGPRGASTPAPGP